MNKIILLAAVATIVPMPGHCYEAITHEALSQQAASLSGLIKDAGLLTGLGLKEGDTFPNSLGQPQTILDLFRFGARHEDTDERPTRHFFDPTTQKGLSSYAASPDWILDATGQGMFDGGPFSYSEALAHYELALSGPAQYFRRAHWGLLFQNLGHVIHHVQDMAQPQHVRDDPHLDTSEMMLVMQLLLYNVRDPSYYEEYTALNTDSWNGFISPGHLPLFDRARYYWTSPTMDGMADFTNQNFVSKDTNFRILKNRSAPNAYSLPAQGPSHLIDVEDSVNGLKPDPAGRWPSGKELCDKFRNDPPPAYQLGTPCFMEFVSTEVHGLPEFKTGVNPRASSFSVFDQYLGDVSLEVRDPRHGTYLADRAFTLNRLNFESGYEFLIPRAVAYSAGLINHFFRGRMELPEPAVVQDGKIQILVKNMSSAGNDFKNGQFLLYYDAPDKTRKAATILTGGSGGTFRVGDTRAITAEVPPDLNVLAADSSLVLVFDGDIGLEEGVAGLVFNAELRLSGFISQPNSIPADGVAGSRMIHFENGAWKLHPLSGASGGSIDWKGRYVNGTPTEVLSWQGPNSRYFEESRVEVTSKMPALRFAPTIWRNGRAHSAAPCNVHGAALHRDTAGDDWVVAICSSATSDRVVRRRNTYNPLVSTFGAGPDSWEELASFPVASCDTCQRAWFFNGEGTEAQTVRAIYRTEQGTSERLKISIRDRSATIENLGNSVITDIRTKTTSSSGCEPDGGPIQVSGGGTHSTSGSSVAAVDYIDSQEVFAAREVDVADVDTYGGAAKGFLQGDGSFQWNYVQSLKWTLRYGSSTLVVDQRDATETGTWSQAGTQGGWTVEDEFLSDRLNVMFMDLRHDTLLAERVLQEGNGSRSATGSAGSVTSALTTTVEYVLHHRGAVTSLYKGLPQHSGGTFVPVDPTVGDPLRPWEDCTGWSSDAPVNGTVTQVVQYTGGGAHRYYDYLGSTAIDRAGRLFTSFQYDPKRHLETSTVFPPLSSQYSSFLTEGNVETLFGIFDPSATYYLITSY